MNVLENFKNLFADVWNKGVSGINISEIIIALIIFIFILPKKTPIKIDWRLDFTYLDVNQLL